MSRRPASDVAVPVSVDGTIFQIATSTLAALPDAPAFIRACLQRGVSPGIASEYARLAAKVFREGRSGEPNKIVVHTQRTAINAYWAWANESYELRVQGVIRAFADDAIRRGVRWLRVCSLVPPSPGKTIPRMTKFPSIWTDGDTRTVGMIPAEITWVPTEAWTLHVPQQECAAHVDPCLDCTPIELDAARLEAVAVAFEKAWGHRDIAKVPANNLLFGMPPRESAPARAASPDGRVLALLMPGALADAVTYLSGSSVRIPSIFAERVAEAPPDVVVISRAAAGDNWRAMLAAVEKAWSV